MMDRESYLVDPFIPDIPINGAPPKGRTFAANIEVAPYSNTLIELIIETLYEVPAHRPDLKSLKERVTLGLEVANQLQDPELWESFLAPDPVAANAAIISPPPPPPAPAPAPAIRIVFYRCTHILDNGKQCARTRKLPLGSTNPRCILHADLGRYPT